MFDRSLLLSLLLPLSLFAESSMQLYEPVSSFDAKTRNSLLCAPFGENHSPALHWTRAPVETQSYVLIMHNEENGNVGQLLWLLYGIPSVIDQLPSGLPRNEKLFNGAFQGLNSFSHIGYDGPCPSTTKKVYTLTLYALDADLQLPVKASYDQVKKAMDGHQLAETTYYILIDKQGRLLNTTSPNPPGPSPREENPDAIEAPSYPPN